MRYRHNIKCDLCSKFIPYKQLEKDGGASRVFIPDSDYSYEEFGFRCKLCTKEHGKVQSYQFPTVDNGIIC